MRSLRVFSRLVIAFLFIISGLIKANDTIGFSYKLTEYFEVFGMDWFIPFALALAMFICVFEIILGFMVLIGSNMKFTSWSLLIMIVFFTFLTFFSAYYNKVTDCGCFGDAIKLTPWESFTKDIILLVFILIVFSQKAKISNLLNKQKAKRLNILVLFLSCFFIFYTYNHLPVKDFRPYAIGKNISEGMKSCDELGLPCTEQAAIYIVKDKQNDQLLEMNSNDWSLKMDRYEYVEFTDKVELLVDGYEPPIHDFSITNSSGYDITDSVLQLETAYLIIAYDISKTDLQASRKLNEFYEYCEKKDILCISLSSSNDDLINDFRRQNNIIFDYAFTDETTLKTIIRSNPGLVQLKRGTITAKWHWNDLPKIGH